jgi:hypothetical protein
MPLPRLLLLTAAPVAASVACAQTGYRAAPAGPETQLLPDRAIGAAVSAVTTKDPNAPALVQAKAAGFIRAGMPVKAVDYLMELKAQYLDYFPHQLLLADCFAASGMREDARVAYSVVINEPGYSEAQRQTATARLRANRGSAPAFQVTPQQSSVPPSRALEPVDGDAAAREASALTKARKFKEAREVLDRAASAGAASRWLSEARINLAIAESHHGAWGPAAADFRTAENDPQLTARERALAAQMSREMLARVKAGVEVRVSVSRQQEGTLWSSGVEVSSGAFGDGLNVVFLRGMWDEIGLGYPRLITREDADRYQAELAWRRITRHGFFGEVSAGGSSEGPVFGAAIGRYELPGTGWELRLRANDPAKDTLLLQALGGTQDSASFHIHRRYSEHWYLDATLGWRRVEMHGQQLGEGIDLEFQLAWTLLEEKGSRPSLALGYTAEVHQFYRRCVPDSFTSALLQYARKEDEPSGILNDRINRHGLVLTAKKHFGARWTAFLYGGAAYEFESDRAEALAGAGVTAWLTENATLVFSFDYASSGNALNAGHDVLTGSMRVRVTF